MGLTKRVLVESLATYVSADDVVLSRKDFLLTVASRIKDDVAALARDVVESAKEKS